MDPNISGKSTVVRPCLTPLAEGSNPSDHAGRHHIQACDLMLWGLVHLGHRLSNVAVEDQRPQGPTPPGTIPGKSVRCEGQPARPPHPHIPKPPCTRSGTPEIRCGGPMDGGGLGPLIRTATPNLRSSWWTPPWASDLLKVPSRGSLA